MCDNMYFIGRETVTHFQGYNGHLILNISNPSVGGSFGPLGRVCLFDLALQSRETQQGRYVYIGRTCLSHPTSDREKSSLHYISMSSSQLSKHILKPLGPKANKNLYGWVVTKTMEFSQLRNLL